MHRREFITLLGSTAVWPLTARAQQSNRIWRIGVLMIIAETESEAPEERRGVEHGLGRVGWEEGKNIQIKFCWAAGNSDRLGADAAELVDSTDLIVAQGTPGPAAALHATRARPILFLSL